MLKKLAVLSALALLPAAAFAHTTVGIAYDNVGINAGPGLHMTLPGGKLTAKQDLGDGYALSGDFVGAGGENHASFYGARVNLAKDLPVLGGTLAPGLDAGFNRLNVGPAQHLEAAYAGFDVSYDYPLSRNFALYANGGFGRNFATSVTGFSTIGGLTYNGGAGADFHVGPGMLTAGYEYRHLPLSSSAGLHLNTGQFTVGYAVRF